jgi:hypothetical protein
MRQNVLQNERRKWRGAVSMGANGGLLLRGGVSGWRWDCLTTVSLIRTSAAGERQPLVAGLGSRRFRPHACGGNDILTENNSKTLLRAPRESRILFGIARRPALALAHHRVSSAGRLPTRFYPGIATNQIVVMAEHSPRPKHSGNLPPNPPTPEQIRRTVRISRKAALPPN